MAEETTEQKKFSDLEFVRIDRPDLFNLLIPRQLFEKVPGRSWSVERLYDIAPLLIFNNFNYIWVLVNEKQVKGVLWVTIDVLSEKLNVITFSIDEEYEDEDILENIRGSLRKFIKEFNESNISIVSNTKIKEKINWVTSQPEMFDKIDGVIPETVLVEV